MRSMGTSCMYMCIPSDKHDQNCRQELCVTMWKLQLQELPFPVNCNIVYLDLRTDLNVSRTWLTLISMRPNARLYDIYMGLSENWVTHNWEWIIMFSIKTHLVVSSIFKQTHMSTIHAKSGLRLTFKTSTESMSMTFMNSLVAVASILKPHGFVRN